MPPLVQMVLGLAVVGAAATVVAHLVRSIAARSRALDDHARGHLRERRQARLPGAAQDRPIEVASAAAVEPRAEAIACPRCGERCHAQSHEVQHHAGQRLRVASVRCGSCGHRRPVYFVLAPERVLN